MTITQKLGFASHVLVFLLLGVASSAFAESSSEPYPYSSNSLDWSSSRDTPYHDDRHKPGYQNNAGYLGADLPPSEYQPDARSREYQRERDSPLPPLDAGQYSSRPNPYCTNGALCGRSSR